MSKAAGLRGDGDFRNEKIGYKIRQATLEKIPYMLIIGDREIHNSNVSVRDRKEGDRGSMNLDDFAALLKLRIKNKS